MRNFTILLVVAALVALSAADVYLHSPRGQNDRCDEKSNNRNNENRGWNSNNNAAGGYSYCDKEMHFYEGTTIRVEWYSQHGCGNGAQAKSDPSNPDTVYCRHLLQLGCDFTFATQTNDPAYYFTDGMSLGRPGADQFNTIDADDGNGNDTYNTFGNTCTDTRPLTLQYQVTGKPVTTTSECGTSATNDAQCNTDLSQGTGTFNSDTCNCHPRKMKTYMLHEPETWYWKCKSRQRNQGLFYATQNINNNNGAHNTRQEPNSNRYGYECTEERDYWPYWHPTPWIDLVVFTSDTTLCPFFQQYSQNVADKCECVAATTITTYPPTTEEYTAQMYNNRIACETANFKWNCTGKWNWPAPACLLAPSQADNRLASIDNGGDNANTGKSKGEALAFYDWVVPSLNSGLFPKRSDPNSGVRCLIRLRYNITAGEVLENYDALNSPTAIKGNPVVSFGEGNYTLPANVTMPLRHAVNTAQYGRTFEDRTYIFNLVPRSAASALDGVTDASFATSTVHNLNVRGKRGNIAQVRNCYEYDFVPRILYAGVGDFIHFQYCLSDYNDNGNAGEGRAGTDRINIVPIGNANKNVLVPSNKTANGAPLLDVNIGGQIFTLADWAAVAFLRQDPKYCASSSSMMGNNNNGQQTSSCHFLNGVRDEANGALPTSYFSHVAKVVSQGNLQYIASRNNNFTNRSQKGTIIVGAVGSAGMIAGATVGAVAGAALIGGGAFFVFKKGLFTASRV